MKLNVLMMKSGEQWVAINLSPFHGAQGATPEEAVAALLRVLQLDEELALSLGAPPTDTREAPQELLQKFEGSQTLLLFRGLSVKLPPEWPSLPELLGEVRLAA